jgi:FkbM family methyltransferase
VPPAREPAGTQILRAFAAAYPSATFIEIGANDGVQEDQLRPLLLSHLWTGVLVEPVPWLFERLRQNYRDKDGLAFENAAISDVDGVVPFFYVAPTDDQSSPVWSDALGSLSRAEVEQTLAAARDYGTKGSGVQFPDLSSRIETIDVPSLTFESLCRKHGIDQLDLLLIDAEGYDWEIVRRIDFGRHRPRLLIFENIHLPAEERDQSRGHLEGLGYQLMYEGFDTWCHDPRADDELARCWHRVRPTTPRRPLTTVLHRIRTSLVTRRTRGSRGCSGN